MAQQWKGEIVSTEEAFQIKQINSYWLLLEQMIFPIAKLEIERTSGIAKVAIRNKKQGEEDSINIVLKSFLGKKED